MTNDNAGVSPMATEDWTFQTPDLRLTVDVGRLAIGTPTHTTRDGFPMSARYAPHLGWLAAVDTDPEG